jgi:hypothetical protein
VSRSLSALLAVVVTVVPIAVGVALAEDDGAAEPVPYEAVPLASYDTSGVVAARQDFCDRLPPEAVADALGGEVTDDDGYADGDDLPAGDGVAHEHGCWARAASGAEAAAWVFTPPVTAERAEDLVAEAGEEDGCEVQQDAPAYGDPTVAVVCGDTDQVTASYRGLFGDAWLTCSLALPGRTGQQELVERAGRWCVAVAEAAAAGG